MLVELRRVHVLVERHLVLLDRHQLAVLEQRKAEEIPSGHDDVVHWLRHGAIVPDDAGLGECADVRLHEDRAANDPVGQLVADRRVLAETGTVRNWRVDEKGLSISIVFRCFRVVSRWTLRLRSALRLIIYGHNEAVKSFMDSPSLTAAVRKAVPGFVTATNYCASSDTLFPEYITPKIHDQGSERIGSVGWPAYS